MQISPASNSQLKLWKKLQMTKYRKKEGLFIAEGERCVEQILDGGFLDVETVIVEEEYEPGFELFRGDYEVVSVTGDDFQTISDTETPQGVLAVCRIPEKADPAELQEKPGLIVALDSVQDPGNVGTIIRTASWFGATGILFGEGTADPFHPKVVRSTAGATGALPYLKGKPDELLTDFEKKGWQVFLMDGSDKAENLADIIPPDKSILVIGNEGSGIAEQLFTPERRVVKIPGNHQTVESLNAAIALGIGLYQFGR